MDEEQIKEGEISIKGLNKAEVLMALYNNSKPQGMGYLHASDGDMDVKEAEGIIAKTPNLYFDYLKGRVLKVDLKGDVLRTRLYDRDLGYGAAERAIKSITP